MRYILNNQNIENNNFFNCKLTKNSNYSINKFSDKRVCKKYKCKIDNILKEKQGDNENVNEAWEKLKKILSDTSVEVLSRIKSTSKLWFSKIC